MNKFQKNLVLGTITSGAIVTLVIVIAFIIHSSLILRNNRRKIQSSNADNLTNTDDIDKERNVTVRTTMVDFDLAVRIARINTKYIGSTLISYTWVPDETMRPISSLGGNINSNMDWFKRGVLTIGIAKRLVVTPNVVKGTMEEIADKSVTAIDNVPSIALFKPMLFSMLKFRTKPLGPRSFKSALRASLLMRTQYGIQKKTFTAGIPDNAFWKNETVKPWSSNSSPAYLFTNTADSFITGNFLPCRSIVLVFKGFVDDMGADFEVTVDGNIVLTGTTKNQPICLAGSLNGAPIVFLLKDLPFQTHVVKITKKGDSGQLILYWGACSTLTDFSELILLKENYLTAEGYKSLNFPIPADYLSTEYPPATNADVDYWNGLMDEVVDELPIEMKNSTRIKVIDLNAAGFDTDMHLLDNGILPNDIGNQFIGDTVLNYLTTLEMRNGANILGKPVDLI